MKVLGYSGFTRSSLRESGRRDFAKTNIEFDNLFAFRDGEVPFTRFPLGYLGHDSAAALVIDGEVVAAAAEERFTRTKHGLNLLGNTVLPRNAIGYCLEEAGIGVDDLDAVAHYCRFHEDNVARRADLLRPFVTAEEALQIETAYQEVFHEMLNPEVVRAQFARITGCAAREVVGVRHHLAHAASAFYVSGFDESLILTLDGTGEVESSILAVGRRGEIDELSGVELPHSLGALYLILTVFLGFRSLGDEYKVMGLASYGDPEPYRRFFTELVGLLPEGRYGTPLLASSAARDVITGALGPPRRPGEAVEPRHANIAASLQEALERAVLHTLAHARSETGLDCLCMAGGVALNCSMNGAVARSGLFRKIFVQPASGDDGGAVGAALFTARADFRKQQWKDARLGPSFSTEEIGATLGKSLDRVTASIEEDIADRVAAELEAGRVVAWFQGRMEYGPRALGARSILADPRDPGMRDRVNARVKRRESFRPFAPAVTEEAASDWFDLAGLASSPFMLFTVPVLPHRRGTIPAVTHVDGTARIQTVSRETNPLFHRLISRFGERTGVPMVLNTSFNVRREPIVCSPDDAVRCLLSTDIDALAIDRFFVAKVSG